MYTLVPEIIGCEGKGRGRRENRECQFPRDLLRGKSEKKWRKKSEMRTSTSYLMGQKVEKSCLVIVGVRGSFTRRGPWGRKRS